MQNVSKSTPISSLGLPAGDHWVKFHIEEDVISFEVIASISAEGSGHKRRQPLGFVEKWGGSMRKTEDDSDAWLTHINEKHLR